METRWRRGASISSNALRNSLILINGLRDAVVMEHALLRLSADYYSGTSTAQAVLIAVRLCVWLVGYTLLSQCAWRFLRWDEIFASDLRVKRFRGCKWWNNITYNYFSYPFCHNSQKYYWVEIKLKCLQLNINKFYCNYPWISYLNVSRCDKLLCAIDVRFCKQYVVLVFNNLEVPHAMRCSIFCFCCRFHRACIQLT